MLSFAQGTLFGGVAVPFFKDLEIHVRFLVALPLLIFAELVVHQRLRPVIQVFRERGIVPAESTSRFEAVVAAAYRLRNSSVAELSLLAFVYAFGIQFFWRNFVALNTTTTWRYVREFERKWLRGGAPADEPFVGSGDIQSLADLGNSLEVVRSMRTFPIKRDAVVRLAVATFAPVVPLALTMMPLEELLKKLFGMIF